VIRESDLAILRLGHHQIDVPRQTSCTNQPARSTSHTNSLCKLLGQVASMARSLSRTTSGNLWKVRTGISSHKMRLDPQCNSLVVIEGWRASGLPMFTEARTVLQGHMQIICCTAILVFARRINPCSTGVEGLGKDAPCHSAPSSRLSRTSEHHHPNIFVLSQEQHLRLNRRRWKNEMMEG